MYLKPVILRSISIVMKYFIMCQCCDSYRRLVTIALLVLFGHRPLFRMLMELVKKIPVERREYNVNFLYDLKYSFIVGFLRNVEELKGDLS